jgi:hypothetical protein
MSQTARFDKEKIISVPKHLLRRRDDASPYGKKRDAKIRSNRILLNKKSKSSLTRGQTMFNTGIDEPFASLVTVERNFVRDLIKSPLKAKSPQVQDSQKNISPSKKKLNKNRFESLTICDFIAHHIKKTSGERRRSKCSVTPDVFTKRK